MPITRVLSAAPPWVFLLTGLAIVVGYVLIPVRQEIRDLRQAQEALASEAAELRAERDREAEMLLAIRGNDRMVLERAAAMYLRRTPPDRFVLEDFEPGVPEVTEPQVVPTPDRDIRFAQMDTNGLRPAWHVATHHGAPHEEGATEKPAADPALASIPPIVTRLLTGPTRNALLAMAGILLLLGLMPARRPVVDVDEYDDEDDEYEEEDWDWEYEAGSHA
jgi:hypothetical protein